MFAVIYKTYVNLGSEVLYQQLWHKIAHYFVQERGALGSCLHRGENGLWLAYSRWPDKKTRDASWPGENTPSDTLPQDIRDAILALKDLTDQKRKLPEIILDVVDDLLLN